MFTLLTAAAAGGRAGLAGGWAAARLALGTRLAVRRVGARACSVRGGGAAGGGRRPGLAAQPPAQRACPRGHQAEPPARPGPLAGRRTESRPLPGCFRIEHGFADFLSKGPANKYFWLWEPHGLCHRYCPCGHGLSLNRVLKFLLH